MSKGKPGRAKWIISDWVDLDEPESVITIIAVVGWTLLLLELLRN
jgi:hypothetical protein